MPTKDDIALMAHLMRRAGFGASRAEVEARAELGYEPRWKTCSTRKNNPPVDDDVLFRYFPNYEGGMAPVQSRPIGCTAWSTPSGRWKKNGPLLAPAFRHRQLQN